MKVAVVIPHGHCFEEVGATSIDLCAVEFARHSKYYKTTMFFVNKVQKPLEQNHKFYRYKNFLQLRIEITNYNPDLIIVHQNLKYAYFLAKTVNTPVILHRHNYYERKSLISSWNKARQFNKLAGIVLVSRSLEDAFCADFPLVTVPIHVVYNGIDTNAWQPSEVRKPVIVFAGRAHPTKGAKKLLGALLEILPKFPNWSAEFYVSRVSLNHQEFIQIMQLSERLPDKISIIRDAPLSRVKTALESAAICVMPTQDPEPFGRSAIEAMAGGAALIASNLGGLSEVLADHASVRLHDVSQDGIKNELLKLMQDMEKVNRLSVAGRHHVHKKFHLKQASDNLDFIYENTVKIK